MKSSLSLIVILLTIPFLDCFCNGKSDDALDCSHCQSSGDFPNSSHDCLEIIDFFVTPEIFCPIFCIEEKIISSLKLPRSDQQISIARHKELYSCFGNLKSNIALNIIQVWPHSFATRKGIRVFPTSNHYLQLWVPNQIFKKYTTSKHLGYLFIFW